MLLNCFLPPKSRKKTRRSFLTARLSVLLLMGFTCPLDIEQPRQCSSGWTVSAMQAWSLSALNQLPVGLGVISVLQGTPSVWGSSTALGAPFLSHVGAFLSRSGRSVRATESAAQPAGGSLVLEQLSVTGVSPMVFLGTTTLNVGSNVVGGVFFIVTDVLLLRFVGERSRAAANRSVEAALEEGETVTLGGAGKIRGILSLGLPLFGRLAVYAFFALQLLLAAAEFGLTGFSVGTEIDGVTLYQGGGTSLSFSGGDVTLQGQPGQLRAPTTYTSYRSCIDVSGIGYLAQGSYAPLDELTQGPVVGSANVCDPDRFIIVFLLEELCTIQNPSDSYFSVRANGSYALSGRNDFFVGYGDLYYYGVDVHTGPGYVDACVGEDGNDVELVKVTGLTSDYREGKRAIVNSTAFTLSPYLARAEKLLGLPVSHCWGFFLGEVGLESVNTGRTLAACSSTEFIDTLVNWLMGQEDPASGLTLVQGVSLVEEWYADVVVDRSGNLSSSCGGIGDAVVGEPLANWPFERPTCRGAIANRLYPTGEVRERTDVSFFALACLGVASVVALALMKMGWKRSDMELLTYEGLSKQYARDVAVSGGSCSTGGGIGLRYDVRGGCRRLTAAPTTRQPGFGGSWGGRAYDGGSIVAPSESVPDWQVPAVSGTQAGRVDVPLS